MKIRPLGTEVLHEDGRTDVTKLIVAFRHFAKSPNKEKCSRKLFVIRSPLDYEVRTKNTTLLWWKMRLTDI
jgi:hypothetical protein